MVKNSSPVAGAVEAVSALNTFILPTHHVNALIMRLGGYLTKDYMRAVGVTVVFLAILMSCLAFLYPI